MFYNINILKSKMLNSEFENFSSDFSFTVLSLLKLFFIINCYEDLEVEIYKILTHKNVIFNFFGSIT